MWKKLVAVIAVSIVGGGIYAGGAQAGPVNCSFVTDYTRYNGEYLPSTDHHNSGECPDGYWIVGAHYNDDNAHGYMSNHHHQHGSGSGHYHNPCSA